MEGYFARLHRSDRRERSVRSSARACGTCCSWTAGKPGCRTGPRRCSASSAGAAATIPTPYLPALAGRVVESAEVERPLPLGFPPHARGHVRRKSLRHGDGVCSEAGLGIYGEAAGVSLEMPEDTLLNKKQVDIPMGEFWVRDLHPPADVLRGRARRGVGVARLRQAARRGGVVHRRRLRVAVHAEEGRRLLARAGHQPDRVPHVGAPAARHQARQHDGRHAHQPQHHVGRAGRRRS